MFGIGPQELIVILVIGLLVLGPKRLPEIARSLGKGLSEFRRASSDLRQSLALDDEPSRQAPPSSAPAQTALASNEDPAEGRQIARPEEDEEATEEPSTEQDGDVTTHDSDTAESADSESDATKGDAAKSGGEAAKSA